MKTKKSASRRELSEQEADREVVQVMESREQRKIRQHNEWLARDLERELDEASARLEPAEVAMVEAGKAHAAALSDVKRISARLEAARYSGLQAAPVPVSVRH